MKLFGIMKEFRIIKFNYINSAYKDKYHNIIEHLCMYKQFTKPNNEIKKLYHVYMSCLLVIFPKLKELLGLEITKPIIYFWLDSNNTEIINYDSDGRDEYFFTNF